MKFSINRDTPKPEVVGAVVVNALYLKNVDGTYDALYDNKTVYKGVFSSIEILTRQYPKAKLIYKGDSVTIGF
ncbi:MAG: hypothetical protein GQ574_14565 [Crocinitomix sp.]|nr:hypothetical protein [Crocinitomix sp.]